MSFKTRPIIRPRCHEASFQKGDGVHEIYISERRVRRGKKNKRKQPRRIDEAEFLMMACSDLQMIFPFLNLSLIARR